MDFQPEQSTEEQKFPDRKQDLDHRELDNYMKKHHIRELFSSMLAYLVENRSEDTLAGAIAFLDQYQPPKSD